MRIESKRLLALSLAVLMLLALAACSKTPDDTDSETLPVIDLDLPVSTSSVETYDPETEPASTGDAETETESGSEAEPSSETEPVGALAMTTASVNLRKTANGEILMQLPKGALVNLLDVSDAEWYQASFNGISGFIASQYLDTKTTEKEMAITGKVTTNSLNVREKAASDGKAIGSLSKDATCVIVAAENGWYKIKYDGGYGYVSSNYVKLITN